MTHGYALGVSTGASGESITIERPNTTASNADGTVTVDVERQTVGCTSPAPINLRFAATSGVELGDVRVMVWASDPRLSFAPKVGDLATFAGESYQVVMAHRIREFGSDVGYDLMLRGSS